jgi:hypothetical protein
MNIRTGADQTIAEPSNTELVATAAIMARILVAI